MKSTDTNVRPIRKFGNKLHLAVIGSALCIFSTAAMPSYIESNGDVTARRAQRFTMMPMTRGVVIKLDKATGRIKIAHDRNEDVELPAATTEFRILLRDLPADIADGASIYFIAARIGPTLMVTRLEPRKAD